jgi:DNA-binding transcriptional regulator GbsR (MarR family)
MTGYSRGSISGGITQLSSLGFIESKIDAKQESKGRRTTRYAVNDGLTGLIAFGIRRLSIELEGMINELGTVKMDVERKDAQSLTALALLEDEAKHNLEKLRKNSRDLLLTKDRSKEMTS